MGVYCVSIDVLILLFRAEDDLSTVTVEDKLLFNVNRLSECGVGDRHVISQYHTEYIKEFDVQGSVHRKYIRFDLFPTRCNFTQFISGKLLYMFRVVSSPIIRSTYKCIYSSWYLLTVRDKNKLLVICIKGYKTWCG